MNVGSITKPLAAIALLLAGWAPVPGDADFSGPLRFVAVAGAAEPEGLTQAQAARFLGMASFGPTPEAVASLQTSSRSAWIDQQLSMPPSLHYPVLIASGDPNNTKNRLATWWQQSLTAPDQLRQRVAFALSELFVISDYSAVQQLGLADYYDLLLTHAFGNFRVLMEDITLSAQMGSYLSMMGNQKETESSGRADENYAREVMQLFTIGLIELNIDGTPKRDAEGKLIPTYQQDAVSELARVFTGWGKALRSNKLRGFDWTVPMHSYARMHDDGAKTIVGGKVIRAGLSPERDLNIALNTLFKHPNVGPFVATHLIKRLVTSNPSPAYVERVARTFNNNGAGVRGDLAAVIRAVLLDDEAFGGRDVNPDFGKAREPLLMMSHLWRLFDGHSRNGTYPYTASDKGRLGQAPMMSATVFNFFSPSFAPLGAIDDAGLVAPELELHTESGWAGRMNELFQYVMKYQIDNSALSEDKDVMLSDFAPAKALAADPAALVAWLNDMLTGGTLDPDFRQQLVEFISSIAVDDGGIDGLRRSQEAIFVIMSSPYYQIQH